MSKKPESTNIIVGKSDEEITGKVCDLFHKIVRESVSGHGVCRLALAGGTTPYLLYVKLAKKFPRDEVPWSNAQVFFGDERDVPQDHSESNYGMAQRTLLDNLPIEPGQVHPMPADAPDLQVAAADYEQRIRNIVPAGDGGVPRFDLILLGMGADGHTASLFPYTEALDEADRLVLSCFVPVLGRNRMTFTFPLINAARHVIVLVTGSDKADAIFRVLGDDDAAKADLPAARIAPAEGALIWALDAEAAKHISPGRS